MLANEIMDNARQRRLLALEKSTASTKQRHLGRRLAMLKFPKRVENQTGLEAYVQIYCRGGERFGAMAQAA